MDKIESGSYYELDEDINNESGQVWSHSLDRTNYYKVVHFRINDLLQSVKKDDYFLINNIAFVFVQTCGTILSKTIIKSKVSFGVNDGTGSITCLVEQDYFNLSESIGYEVENNNAVTDQDHSPENNAILKGIAVLSSSLSHFVKALPKDEQDLKIGDVVSLVGKLSENNGVFYIFVDKLFKKNISDFIEHLNHQKIFYGNLDAGSSAI